MQVYRSLQEMPVFEKGVLTLGTFDGWHLGHRKILNTVKDYAKDNPGFKSAVITFTSHPLSVIKPEKCPPSLTSIRYKARIVEENNVDLLILIDFTKEFADISAQDFINILLSKFKRLHMVIGYDLHFGKGNKGDVPWVKSIAAMPGSNLSVEVIEKVMYEDTRICSSCIRNFIMQGRIEDANKLLGRPYFIRGKVIHGDHFGKQTGFPTVNIYSGKMAVPKEGVYLTSVEYNDIFYHSMTFVGRKTIGTKHTEMLIESYIFDFDKEIYEKEIRVYFHKFMREKIPINSLEHLKETLEKDKQQVLKEIAVNAK